MMMGEEPTTTFHDVRSLQEYSESCHTIQRIELRGPSSLSGGGPPDGGGSPPQPPPHTGVTHFRHVNDPNLRTFLFSAGRHSDNAINTFVTVDFSRQDDDDESDENPFVGVVERPLVVADDENDDDDDDDDDDDESSSTGAASCCTWVSAATVTSPDGVPTATTHYALFSGGSVFDANHRPVDVGPSRLYSFREDEDGSLRPAKLVWVEDIPDEGEGTTNVVGGFDFVDESSDVGAINPDGRGARFGLLADLGDIYDSDGTQVSFRGEIDIVVSGTRGVQIYSRGKGKGTGKGGGNSGTQWEQIRSTPILGMTSTAYVGVCHCRPPRDPEKGYLLVSNRSYNQTDEYYGKKLDAPCLVYDYRNDRVVREFASQGQIESIASLDGGSKVLVGAGGEAGIRGQPNLSYDVIVGTTDDDGDDSYISLRLSDTQLVRGMPVEFGPMEGDDPTPLDATKYFGIPAPGNTKTRQVLAFRLLDTPDDSHDFVLEVNSAQPCCIYCRDGSSSGGVAYRVIPLPGSEGTSEKYARAGDVLCFRNAVYVILAMYNSSNVVYRLHPSSLVK